MHDSVQGSDTRMKNYVNRALDVIRDHWDAALTFFGGALAGSGVASGAGTHIIEGAITGLVGVNVPDYAPSFLVRDNEIQGADYTCRDSRSHRNIFTGAAGFFAGLGCGAMAGGIYPTTEQAAGYLGLVGLLATGAYLFEKERQQLTYKPRIHNNETLP